MRKILLLLLSCSLLSTASAQPADYEWNTPSRNSSESMPCGGGDIGMNVWVEQGDILFYLSRSGSFDENNTLLKQGRFRISLTPAIDLKHFRQILHLKDGYVEVTDGYISVQLWADVQKPVVHVEIESLRDRLSVAASYENWRTSDILLTKREVFQSSYKFSAPKGLKTQHDRVVADDRGITFLHRNGETTIFDATVKQQQLDDVKYQLTNPLKDLTFGGRMEGAGFVLIDSIEGRYGSADCKGWMYVSQRPVRRCHLQVTLASAQGTMDDWQAQLTETARKVRLSTDRRNSRRWWNRFWQRSTIESLNDSPLTPAIRNYSLFRYMLACNARGPWPTKFNGGLFTFDPEFVNVAPEYRLTPDYRNWGGGVHTAQNQRLVYWPMLKNGDYDLLLPQLDFYLNIYKNAEVRSRHYWGHEGACLTEQVENYGLPCYPEYGTKRPDGFDPGLEHNAWLEYEWDTCLEFCMMALEAHRYNGTDISRYVPMIRSCLRFFDEHYQYLAKRRGAKALDDGGKLVLYPGSGGETFKMAYNSTSTIAALRTVAQAMVDMGYDADDTVPSGEQGIDNISHSSFLISHFLRRLPDITVRDGMIAPAVHYERVQNTEPTQLYPVFPWRIYGVGRPDLDVARRTYEQDTLAVKFRSHVGWKQDAIWAACLGMTDEAVRLVRQKMGDGPHRFPAFWGPGFDWTPDHNWGGSGMIAMQEMLLQEADNKLYIFPAWPRDCDVHFRLHAARGTTVEAELRGGRVTVIRVLPKERQADIVLPDFAK